MRKLNPKIIRVGDKISAEQLEEMIKEILKASKKKVK
jgi:hypothetical protein